MRLATVETGGTARWGAMHEDGFADMGGLFPGFADLSAAAAAGALPQLFEAAATAPVTHRDLRFLPPLPHPEKIICVGVNYPERNAEYLDGQAAPENPSLFVRFPRSLTGHDQPLIRPRASRQLDYEGELAVVIGTGGRHIAEGRALDHVAALTICNEGTLRDWVRHAKFNVTQGKNFDRSGAMGPWLVPFHDASQVTTARLTTRVNGEIRQDDVTGRMVFPVARQIAYISTFTTLVPGDIIVTGTPAGAGARMDPPRFLAPGDVVEVAIDGIGTLRNTVADEA